MFKLSKFEELSERLFCFSSHWPSAFPDELTTRCSEFALLKIDARLFSELQPSISIEFIPTLCFIIEYVDGTQCTKSCASPHQRIVSYECMNPRCDKSFSNLHRDSYEVHRFHARNVGTLCASLTMLREIVATRRTGVTTSVIRRIPSTGKQCAYIHIILMTVLLP